MTDTDHEPNNSCRSLLNKRWRQLNGIKVPSGFIIRCCWIAYWETYNGYRDRGEGRVMRREESSKGRGGYNERRMYGNGVGPVGHIQGGHSFFDENVVHRKTLRKYLTEEEFRCMGDRQQLLVRC